MSKVICADCQNPILSERKHRVYCPTKERWVPNRKFSRRRSCSLHMPGPIKELLWERSPVHVPRQASVVSEFPTLSKQEVLASRRPVKVGLLRRILNRISRILRMLPILRRS